MRQAIPDCQSDILHKMSNSFISFDKWNMRTLNELGKTGRRLESGRIWFLIKNNAEGTRRTARKSNEEVSKEVQETRKTKIRS